MRKFWIFVFLSISLHAQIVPEVYEVNFQMDEAARQIQLKGKPLQDFEQMRDVTIFFWKNDASFYALAPSMVSFLDKAPSKKLGIVMDTDSPELKRIKMFVNTEYNVITDPVAVRKLMTSITHYADIFDVARGAHPIFGRSSPGVLILGADGSVVADLTTSEQLENYDGKKKPTNIEQ